MNSRAFRVCKSMGIRSSYMFAIRSIFQVRGMMLVLLVTAYLSMLFGHMFRLIELQNYDLRPDGVKFTFINGIWTTIVSMTTVGYGDMIPLTGTGNCLGILCVFVGMHLTAIFIITLSKALLFTNSQEVAHFLIESVRETEDIKQKAKNHIVSYYKLHHRNTPKGREIFKRTHNKSLSVFERLA